MTELDYLPVGAVVISAQTGAALMRRHGGWVHIAPGIAVGMPVAEHLFAEAERTAQ